MYTWDVHRNIHRYSIDLHQQTISRSQGILLLMKLTKFSPPPLPQHSPLPQALLSLIKRQLVASQRTFCPWTLVCIFNNYQNCSIISRLKADLKCVSEETCFLHLNQLHLMMMVQLWLYVDYIHFPLTNGALRLSWMLLCTCFFQVVYLKLLSSCGWYFYNNPYFKWLKKKLLLICQKLRLVNQNVCIEMFSWKSKDFLCLFLSIELSWIFLYFLFPIDSRP